MLKVYRRGNEVVDISRANMPLDPSMDLWTRKEHEEELDALRIRYVTIPGKLRLFSGMTRPDPSSSLRELGRRGAPPYLRHWRGLQHILRYLATTRDVCLLYGKATEKNDKSALIAYRTPTTGERHGIAHKLDRVPVAAQPIANFLEIQAAGFGYSLQL